MDYKEKYFRYKNKLQQLGAAGGGGGGGGGDGDDAAITAMYARISSTRRGLGLILRFAGGPEGEWSSNLLRSFRFVLLPMLTTKEANNLRLVCKELKKEVEEFPGMIWRQ